MAVNALRIPLVYSANPNPSGHSRKGSSLAQLRCPPHGAVTAAWCLRSRPLYWFPYRRRFRVGYAGRAADDGKSDRSDMEFERKMTTSDENNDLEEAWKQVIVNFEALKMQLRLTEAHKAKVKALLEEISTKMTIQGDEARSYLAEITKELEDAIAATEQSNESVKDVVEVFSSLPRKSKDISKVHDFHIAIPLGSLLAIGGFASFMITGNTSAIRFGLILGGALLALGMCSLRAWRSGRTSLLFLCGQTAISTIIFIREWHLFFQKFSLPSALTAIASGTVVAFFIYRIISYRQDKRSSLDRGSEC